jgi:penicillin-binding protein 2
MLRRDAMAALAVSACSPARAADARGAAVLVDVRSRRLLGLRGNEAAGRAVAPPGSALKPVVLAALLRLGKLSEREAIPCPGTLAIGGHSLNCSHPPTDVPMRVETALAYSCNCFVARVAERFEPGELARELEAAGLASRTGLLGSQEAAGRIVPARSADAIRLQALGEEGVAVTVAGLAMAYRLLALDAHPAVIAGLEGAVEYGTAQNARLEGTTVAGKTGSVRADHGERIAWFAGFVPSRAPELAIAAMVQGRSGGADAAPIARQMLAVHRAGRL